MSQEVRKRDGEQGAPPGSLVALPLPQMATISGTTGVVTALSACTYFSTSLIRGDLRFGGQQRGASSLHSDTCAPAHRCFSTPGTSYLLRCPCCPCTGSPWPRRSPRPSTPAGRRSASRSGPVCICRCCCTDPGSPLSKDTRKKKTTRDLSAGRFRTSGEQIRDTEWEQAFVNSTDTVIAHVQEQQHYLRNLILIQVASLIGLTLETPLTWAGQKYMQQPTK